MNFFITSFFVTSIILNIKKILTKKVVWIAFFVLPISIFFIGNIDNSLPVVTVGISFEPNDNFSRNIFDTVTQQTQDNPFLSFITFYNIEEMKNAIYVNSINHGYIFTQNLSNDPFSYNAIQTFVSPRTLAIPIVNEIVSAAILYHGLHSITLDVMDIHFPQDDVYDFVTESIEFYREQDIFMTPTMISVTKGNPIEEIQNVSTTRINLAVIGITLLAILIFVTPMFISEKNSGILTSLNTLQVAKSSYYFSIWTSVFLILFLIGSVATFFLNFHVNYFVFLFLYVLKNVIIMAVLYLFMKNDSWIQNFGIFIIIINIFFGGVLIDLNEINETLGAIQNFFPLFHYINFLI